MPDNNSDNQAKIDREHSMWESQRRDLERLLVGALENLRKFDDWKQHPYFVYARSNITDALSVLENMEEGEVVEDKRPTFVCPTHGRFRGFSYCPGCKNIDLHMADFVGDGVEPPAEEPVCDECGVAHGPTVACSQTGPPAEEPDHPPFTMAGKMIEKMNAEEPEKEGE